MPKLDEFGGIAIEEPQADEFGGIPVQDSTDEFGGIPVADEGPRGEVLTPENFKLTGPKFHQPGGSNETSDDLLREVVNNPKAPCCP
jgi:hypothetical protein